jgi:hypothetical protein
LSPEILDELLSVLATKFSRDKEEISRVAVILAEIAQISGHEDHQFESLSHIGGIGMGDMILLLFGRLNGVS